MVRGLPNPSNRKKTTNRGDILRATGAQEDKRKVRVSSAIQSYTRIVLTQIIHEVVVSTKQITAGAAGVSAQVPRTSFSVLPKIKQRRHSIKPWVFITRLPVSLLLIEPQSLFTSRSSPSARRTCRAMSDSSEKSWSDSPNAPQVPYSLYLTEKEAFAGQLLGAMFYGAQTYASVYMCSPCPFNPPF